MARSCLVPLVKTDPLRHSTKAFRPSVAAKCLGVDDLTLRNEGCRWQVCERASSKLGSILNEFES